MAAESDRFHYHCAEGSLVETALVSHIQRHRLLQGVSRLGLAVSGGADSLALFHLMLPLCREAGIIPVVLHLNHGLRKESDEEERFVRSLAVNAKVPFHCHRAKLSSHKHDGVSLEMAARAARMGFFRQCVSMSALDAVATGHQADDVAETYLLRLARGAGAGGLAGLRPVSKTRDLILIRPLLAIAGAALRDWLRSRGLSWCEDASNHDETIPRNYVRHTLLPHLEQTWAPGLRARLCQSAETLREDDKLLDALASQQLASMLSDQAQKTDTPLPVTSLLQQPVALQRRILRQWLFLNSHAEATGFDDIQALLTHCHEESGLWQHALPGSVLAVCRDGTLTVAPQRESPSLPPITLPIPSRMPIRWGNIEITAVLDHGIVRQLNGFGVYPAVCSLSAAALEGHTLVVRARRPGDRIAPVGLRGTKKIQDLFVDEKVPEHLRDSIPLFVCDGEVAWVPGYRVARRFSVPSSNASCVRVTLQTAT